MRVLDALWINFLKLGRAAVNGALVVGGLTTSSSIVVGAPAGGDKGVGAINAQTTWLNGVQTKGFVKRSSATLTTTPAGIATVIPDDNTIPQSGEGTQILTLAHTPDNANNILCIRGQVNGSLNTAGNWAATLFQSGSANAIGGGISSDGGAGAIPRGQISFEVWMVAGGVGAITFSINAGTFGAGTLTINGVGGNNRFGGAMFCSIYVEEYTP